MGKIAFIFAGQGAQYSGMGQRIALLSPAARAIFEAADALRPGTSEQCFRSGAEELTMTQNTQPCVFCVDLACAEALREQGISPDAVAGFSLGEVAAAAFCNMLCFEDAFRLVCRRGELMAACARENPGVMSAVLKLPAQKVEALAAQLEGVYPVNFNSPGQTVVAGRPGAMDEFDALVAREGGRALRLSVSGGFHTPFMERASTELFKYMQPLRFSPPMPALYSNTTALPYSGDPRLALAKQITNPVRWQSTVQNMIAEGFDTFIELGPGSTLCGLIRRIDKGVKTANVEDPETLAAALDVLRRRSE